MLRRLRLFLNARSSSSRRLVHARTSPRNGFVGFVPPGKLETLHEVAVYLHRFHNLDLFHQGWYQIKISMRWEDSGRETIATPARVVQYEGLVPDEILGVWSINDTDHSFSTQPFRIKYARQDVLLSVMISFSLPLGKDEIPSTSAVILKFELTHTPIGENGTEMQASLDTNSAAVHEFRIPRKALLGLHSYCPVHFDAYHAVLVDLSVHTVFIKAGAYTPSQKVTSNLPDGEFLAYKYKGSDNDTAGSNLVELVKALSTSRDILLKELQKISNAIGQTIDDVSESSSDFGIRDLTFGTESSSVNGDRSGDFLGYSKLSNGLADHGSDTLLSYSSSEELLSRFHFLGGQLSLLWNTFLKFHRKNKSKILEYLRGTWCGDRKAEWSIWMVHSKADIPHRYLKSGVDESFYDGVLGKPSLPRKLSDDPVQLATTRAELHRKSIAQMNINNHSIQDMHIYGDPSCIPVVILEKQVMENPVLASSHQLSLDSLDQKNIPATNTALGNKVLPKLLGCELQKGGRVLKVVVFVHGFQGHHLDLRLIRNQWLLIDPGAECLMSEANEEKTSGDFREMGGRLADEVSAFLRKKLDKASRSGGCRDIRLSFVGHSIGNIIIRSALTESVMEPYLRYLYTYMSLSGPHLGYWYSSNSLFNSGLWILKKLKGNQCIHQLTFSDAPDLQNTFFYKLCQQKTLEYFRNTILLSSPQDGYVPYHSARIELCPASSSDNSKKAEVFMEMLNNCLDQIRAPSSQQRTFIRCDVNFDMSSQGRSLNTIIGRAAHIEFLETDNFAKFMMWSYPDLFQ